MLLAACSAPQRPQEPASPVLVIPVPPTRGSAVLGPPAAEADVIQYLEKEAAFQAKAYPQIRVTNVRFNEDQTWACGVLEHPGERPLVFSSVDATPQTVERSLALGYLHLAGEWRHGRTAQREQVWRRRCEDAGLLPELPAASEGAPTP